MENESWKAGSDFVEALLILESKGEKLTTTNVAALLDVSKPAIHQLGDKLIAAGLITRESYGDIQLTADGRALAEKTYKRHMLIKGLLTKIGVSDEQADKDSCLIEHVLSEETVKALEKYQ